MAENSSNRSRIWITIVGVLIVGGLLLYAFPRSRNKIAVRTARVDRQPLINKIATNGRVDPVQDYQAHAPMPSVIEALPVRLGQHVSRGQELIRLDASDAQSKLAAAEATA